MISLFMMTPHEIAEYIARQAQAKRLSLNFSQRTLSQHSGVSFGVLKKFERTGQISLESLLKIALALDSLEEFKSLFKAAALENSASLDNIIKLKDKKRKRGRQ